MAWNLLLSSDIGLMSLFTIIFMLFMGVFMYRYAVRHAAADKAQHDAVSKKAPRAR